MLSKLAHSSIIITIIIIIIINNNNNNNSKSNKKITYTSQNSYKINQKVMRQGPLGSAREQPCKSINELFIQKKNTNKK